MPSENSDFKDRMLALLAAVETGPSASDLAVAPRFEIWRPLLNLSGTPVLWGYAFGHPRLGNTFVLTSVLIGFDAGHGWARTVNRWYRLEVPFRALAAEISGSIEPGDLCLDGLSFDLPGHSPFDDLDSLTELLARRNANFRKSAGPERPH